MYKVAETERLILREFLKDDCNNDLSFLTDPNVCNYMTLRAIEKSEIKAYIDKIIRFKTEVPRRFIKFMVILKCSDEVIGECGILMPNAEHETGELIFRYSAKYWGHGYATEAAKEMIDYGFNTLKLHRIEAICDVRNKMSSKVLEKLGMKLEGRLREHKIVKGERRSSHIYSSLKYELT